MNSDPTAEYIAELRRLLRTDPKTRRRIVQEVEDHLYNSSLANENWSSANSLEDRFGSATYLAEQFNALAHEGRKGFLAKAALTCVTIAIALALVAPSNLTRSLHGNARVSAPNLVKVDPSTGAIFPNQENRVHIDPMTGRMFAVVALLNDRKA